MKHKVGDRFKSTLVEGEVLIITKVIEGKGYGCKLEGPWPTNGYTTDRVLDSINYVRETK